MSSHFGWVDFAEDDRQRMLDVVRLFQEQETRDELGVGTIRDAFSDYLLPGTSTIQTRARYMLFVPWIYKRLEGKGLSGAEMERQARADEIRLIRALLKSDDTEGVIGKESLERLQRLPSVVYWTGLYSWGIRSFAGTRSEYHRHLQTYYRQKKYLLRTDDNEPISVWRENWDPHLPEPPKNLLQHAELALTLEDAMYLQERVLAEHPDSLLACFLSAGPLADTAFLWEQPLISSLPGTLQRVVSHARNFSLVIHGAAILYNLMLARKSKRENWIEEYEIQQGQWVSAVQDRWPALKQWYGQRVEFWDQPFLGEAIPRLTVAFVEDWLSLVFEGGRLRALRGNEEAHKLIQRREVFLKGARSRLENPRALKAWTGASGTTRLSFRWANVKIIIADILEGLQRRPAGA